MKVKVLYFSSIKDKLNKSSEIFDIENNINLQEFIDLIKNKYPKAKDSLDSIMLAVNEEYKDKDYILKDGDVVALIPPVSGG